MPLDPQSPAQSKNHCWISTDIKAMTLDVLLFFFLEKKTIFRDLLLLSSPLWRLSVNTCSLFQRVLTGAPDLARTERTPHPLPIFHYHFIPYQMQVQIRDSDTLVKPAGLKAYVSLPSACIRVLAFSICTHCLLY